MSNVKKIIKACEPFIERNDVLEIGEDSECYEVIMRDGLINYAYNETMWVFGKHNLDDMSVGEMIDDLELWLDGLQEVECE